MQGKVISLIVCALLASRSVAFGADVAAVNGAELDATLSALGKAPLQTDRYYTIKERTYASGQKLANEFTIVVLTTSPYKLRVNAAAVQDDKTTPLYCFIGGGTDEKNAVIDYQDGVAGAVRVGKDVVPSVAVPVPTAFRPAATIRTLFASSQKPDATWSIKTIASLCADVPIADIKGKEQLKKSENREGFPFGNGGNFAITLLAAEPMPKVAYFDLPPAGVVFTGLWAPFQENYQQVGNGGVKGLLNGKEVSSETLSVASVAANDDSALKFEEQFDPFLLPSSQIIQSDTKKPNSP